MTGEDKYIANRIRDVIKAIDPQAHIILFGSRARGEAKKDSYWDILILIDSQVNIEIERSFRYTIRP